MAQCRGWSPEETAEIGADLCSPTVMAGETPSASQSSVGKFSRVLHGPHRDDFGDSE